MHRTSSSPCRWRGWALKRTARPQSERSRPHRSRTGSIALKARRKWPRISGPAAEHLPSARAPSPRENSPMMKGERAR
eukprot:7603756-Pyramimonas_sp.AAC.1